MKKYFSWIANGLCLVGFCWLISCQKNDETANIAPASEATSTTLNSAVAATATESLGKLLFYDPILSGKKDVACATCHHPANGYADALDLSIGVNGVGLGRNRRFLTPNTIPFAKRNSMTILNTIYNGMDANGNFNPANAPMFWDSRIRSLEAQSLEPIKKMEEMRGTVFTEANALDSVVNRLKKIPEYQQLFTNAFGANQMTAGNVGKAIASFERTLVAMNSPFDRYQRGETTALSVLQVQGLQAFRTSGCAACHSGNMFSDYQLHVLSVPDNAKSTSSDAGANNTYAFRTASLRNVTLTAPFMHSGVFQDLNDVVRFYGRIAGGNSQNPNVTVRQIDPRIRNVRIRNNQAALVAFINSLTDTNFDKTVPVSVPSRLSVGGNIR